jgi:hypothetical protein
LAEHRVLPMELQVGDRLTDEAGEYEVIGRPYTTNVGKVGAAPGVMEVRTRDAHERVSVKRSGAKGIHRMMRYVTSLALAVAATELTGCSRESAGERLTRECRESVDGATDSENATNPDVATVKREVRIWRP